MAVTNGDGNHVAIEMAAPFVLGTSHTYRYAEASFYGNLFVDPPQAFYCVGDDYAESGVHVKLLESRACVGYNEKSGVCPYVRTGYCAKEWSRLYYLDKTVTGDEKCSFGYGSDTAHSCKSGSGYATKVWSNPISTYRQTRE